MLERCFPHGLILRGLAKGIERQCTGSNLVKLRLKPAGDGQTDELGE